jgi:hypothetical protein
MTPPTVVGRESDKIADIVNKILDNKVDSVSIVDSAHHLKAIITLKDLLKLVTLPAQALQEQKIKINSELDDIDREEVRELVTSVTSKYVSILKNHPVDVFIKEHKEKQRGRKLIYTRIQIHADKEKFDAKAEGWGYEHSVSEALDKIDKQVRRRKAIKKTVSKRRK